VQQRRFGDGQSHVLLRKGSRDRRSPSGQAVSRPAYTHYLQPSQLVSRRLFRHPAGHSSWERRGPARRVHRTRYELEIVPVPGAGALERCQYPAPACVSCTRSEPSLLALSPLVPLRCAAGSPCAAGAQTPRAEGTTLSSSRRVGQGGGVPAFPEPRRPSDAGSSKDSKRDSGRGQPRWALTPAPWEPASLSWLLY